jgi:SpoU rRNA methylase family enzyme
MNAVRGRVRGGRIEIDTTLPEGVEVVVLSGGAEEPFDLDEARMTELEARMLGADLGEVEPAAAVLARLRGGQ